MVSFADSKLKKALDKSLPMTTKENPTPTAKKNMQFEGSTLQKDTQEFGFGSIPKEQQGMTLAERKAEGERLMKESEERKAIKLNEPTGSFKEQVQRSIEEPAFKEVPFGIMGPVAIPNVKSLKTTGILAGTLVALTAGGTAAAGTIGRFVTNAASLTATKSWVQSLATGLKNPAVLASTVVAAIGSYPFAGFIKEEALQTLSMGVKTAVQNNDLEGAELALREQDELLDPGLWDGIINKIPFANVINNLKDFYDAASVKQSIDQDIVDRMKRERDERIAAESRGETVPKETGINSDSFWEKVRQDELDMEKAAIDYYNQERKLLL